MPRSCSTWVCGPMTDTTRLWAMWRRFDRRFFSLRSFLRCKLMVTDETFLLLNTIFVLWKAKAKQTHTSDEQTTGQTSADIEQQVNSLVSVAKLNLHPKRYTRRNIRKLWKMIKSRSTKATRVSPYHILIIIIRSIFCVSLRKRVRPKTSKQINQYVNGKRNTQPKKEKKTILREKL